ncbi:MAG: hypothetical protein ACREIS_04525 [Nitrospiraceae bacterium]
MIAPGQTVGDIIQETDLFTTFARIGGATEHIPTDRIIDGVDQTALFLKGDGFSRRDYVYIYTGSVLAATVKGRSSATGRGKNTACPGRPSSTSTPTRAKSTARCSRCYRPCPRSML